MRKADWENEKYGVRLYLGDCLEVMGEMGDGEVDAVVTDPPYPRDFLPVLAECWSLCAKICTQEAFVFTMSGQLYMDSVMEGLRAAGWRYLWCGNFPTPRARCAIWPRGISAGWKPLLIYGRERMRFAPWKCDVIKPVATRAVMKRDHPWGQCEEQFETLLQRFDLEGNILDPFMGGGTTGVACVRTG